MSVKAVKNLQKTVFEKFKVNAALFIQAGIYAAMLMGGVFFGIILRLAEVQGFTIFGLVAAINLGATYVVFKGLKRNLKDLWPTEETEEGKKKRKNRSQSTYTTASDL